MNKLFRWISIHNFCDTFISDFNGVSYLILEMFFNRCSVFLAGFFKFSFLGAAPFSTASTATLSVILFTQPLRSGRVWHKVNFFKQSLTGLNSELSFS